MKRIPYPIWLLISVVVNVVLFYTVAFSLSMMRLAVPTAPEGSMRVTMKSTAEVISMFTPPPAEIKSPEPPPIEKLFPKEEREQVRKEINKVAEKKLSQGVARPLPAKPTGVIGVPHPDAGKPGISGPGSSQQQTAQPSVITGNNERHVVSDTSSPQGNGAGGTDNIGPAPGGGTGGGQPKGVAVISLGRPGYSKTADDVKFTGTIVVTVALDSTGKVVSADVSSKIDELNERCRSAALKSKFDPATDAEGQTIASTGKISFVYRNGALVDRTFIR